MAADAAVVSAATKTTEAAASMISAAATAEEMATANIPEIMSPAESTAVWQ
jgi:hypothetical protein